MKRPWHRKLLLSNEPHILIDNKVSTVSDSASTTKTDPNKQHVSETKYVNFKIVLETVEGVSELYFVRCHVQSTVHVLLRHCTSGPDNPPKLLPPSWKRNISNCFSQSHWRCRTVYEDLLSYWRRFQSRYWGDNRMKSTQMLCYRGAWKLIKAKDKLPTWKSFESVTIVLRKRKRSKQKTVDAGKKLLKDYKNSYVELKIK